MGLGKENELFFRKNGEDKAFLCFFYYLAPNIGSLEPIAVMAAQGLRGTYILTNRKTEGMTTGYRRFRDGIEGKLFD